jgi:DNA-binding XRE family transcriptional regulator
MKKENSPLGRSWAEYKETLLTPEERKEIEIKTRLTSEILQARRESGVTQKQLEEASGVKQPVIARVENGKTDPQLSTVLKILGALGKTIAIVPKHEAC